MLIKEIEKNIQQKNTQGFLNIIKKISCEDYLRADNSGFTALHICVKHNAMKEILMLLDMLPKEEENKLINQKTKGLCPKTPLQIASENQNDKVTKFLIERGATVTEEDIDQISNHFRKNVLFLSYLNEVRETKFKKEKKFWFF